MNRLSNAHHFRKQVAGICMLVAPALLLAGVIIHPETGTSRARSWPRRREIPTPGTRLTY